MKTAFPARRNAPTLELFFTGWGMDARPFARAVQSPRMRGCDFALCYDYSDTDFSLPDVSGYAQVRVRAWSLGVYAAAVALAGTRLPVERAVAVNGTLYPVDDERGIPTAVYDATLRGLEGDAALSVVERFTRRMCGPYLEDFAAQRPARSVDSLRDELAAVRAHAASRRGPLFTAWDLAVLSRRDRIFPIDNMRRAWAGTPIAVLDGPHYLPDLPFAGD
ncbi:MAG: DUF452 family protein [Desulfovibrio desulfuricans]|jgi:hypothetical protein|nr:DUF452 family protein [Desulfovibrio desulfuricans]